jgi:HD-GYP domain-containing protein (c-di-GMP phosphodiesterase class II)
MSSILVWGKTREIIAGELPPGISTEEVATFSAVKSEAQSRGAILVLADATHLDAERDAVAQWVKSADARRTLLVGVSLMADADDLIRRHPYLDDVMSKPVTALRLRLRLDRALDGLNSRRVIQQLDTALARKSQDLHELNNIGVALSAQRDINKLLELILAKSRAITASDAGTLYLVVRGKEQNAETEDCLEFVLAQNESVPVAFEKRTVPLDAYQLPPGTPYTISRTWDERSGYRTKSMLVVPMRDHQGTVIGVVQLINKKREAKTVLRPVALVDEAVVPFTSVDEELVSSLASQAAVAFENTRLIQDIRNLFDSFVRASVTAIESRDPTTSGHSGRVATLTVALAENVDGIEAGPFREVSFNRDQLQEIRYASLLHDFGKVGVREKVLIKGKKLYVGELLLLRQRFAYIKRTLEAEHFRAKLEQVTAGQASAELLAQMDRAYEKGQEEVDQILRMILQANEPTILEEESFRALMDLPNRTYNDAEGNRQPFLSPNEVSALSIRKGSLSEKERREIESHVTHTFKFLSEIPWTGEFRRVPEIAYAHHEKMDGTGYPRKLAATDIPIQSRMMTISDIFDALVAWDRPYKKSVPVERALDILRDEARTGKLDNQLLDVFVEAKVYEKTLPRAGAPAELAR